MVVITNANVHLALPMVSAVIRRNTNGQVFLRFFCCFFTAAWKITFVGKQRSDAQAVEAFSAPKDLLRRARRRAVSLGMTMSGYLRYVVALELGYSPAEARDLALHPSVHKLRRPAQPAFPTQSAGPVPFTRRRRPERLPMRRLAIGKTGWTESEGHHLAAPSFGVASSLRLDIGALHPRS